jgi:hypothetical protein
MNPFAPIAAKDSPLDRISPRRQSRVRAAVCLVLALHLFALTGFLIRDFAKAQFRIAATTTSTTTNALVSSGTTDAPAPDRSPTIPSNSQSPAPSPSRSMTAALPGATAVTRESGSPSETISW